MCGLRPPTCRTHPRRRTARAPPRPSYPDCSPWRERRPRAEETAFHLANPTASPRVPPHTNRSTTARHKAATKRRGVTGDTTFIKLNAGSSGAEVVTRSSSPCRTALQEQVLYGGSEWPIRVVKWACFIDGRRGRVAAVLPHPLSGSATAFPASENQASYPPAAPEDSRPLISFLRTAARSRGRHTGAFELSATQPAGGCPRRGRLEGGLSPADPVCRRKPGILSLGPRSSMDHGSEHTFAP